MGQQQLLLLVLGVVLVGLAVVVGIDGFRENQRKSELDRLTVEAHRVAATAYGWKQTPHAMGGGAGVPWYSTLTLDALGFTGAVVTENGSSMQVLRGGIEYKLMRRELPRTHLSVYNPELRIGVAVFFLGPGPECFAFRMQHVDSRGRTVYTPSMTPPQPAGCTGWNATGTN